MKLTALKPVNVRLGQPSVNAPNPSFLAPGDQVTAIKRVLGDIVNEDNEWIFTDANTFISAAGFLSQEKAKVQLDVTDANLPLILKRLEIDKLWSAGNSKGEGISIGIIDNGVSQNNILNNKIVPLNYDFSSIADLENHGTYMASIIGAYSINSGQVGIAPGVAKIYSYRISEFSPVAIFEAITTLMMNNVSIINMSFSSNFNESEFAKVREKLVELRNSNILCICATGNESVQNKVFPAALDGVISVAGYDLNSVNKGWPGSNIWPEINISAPYNNFFEQSFLTAENKGTSISCAILTGIMACCYNMIKSKAKGKAMYNYLKEDVFPLLPKREFFNNISIPAYSTNNFIKLLKN